MYSADYEGFDAVMENQSLNEINEGNAPIATKARKILKLSDAVSTATPLSWTVQGWLTRGEASILYGKSGAGKSFAGLDIALSIADPAITEWHGHKVHSGAVVYLCGEGYAGLVRRAQAWVQEKTSTPMDDIELYIKPRGEALNTGGGVDTLISEIEELELNEAPALTVVDTLNRHVEGDENTADTARQFLAAVDALRYKYGCGVLIVHHSGKDADKGSRGSSAFRAGVDAEIMVTRTRSGIKLEHTKSKDGELRKLELDLIPVDIKGVYDEYGVQVSTLVCGDQRADRQSDTDGEAGIPPKEKQEKPLTKPLQRALQVFRAAARKHGRLNADGEFIGVHLENWREVAYQKSTADSDSGQRADFKRQRDALINEGILVVDNKIYNFNPDRDAVVGLEIQGITEHLRAKQSEQLTLTEAPESPENGAV